MRYEPAPRHVCLTRDGIYLCTLPTGHTGPHQAWAGTPDSEPRHQWDQENTAA